MVAHDEVDAQCLGIGDFINGFHAAVEHDDQAYSGLLGIVHSRERYTVSVVISVGDIVVDVRGELLQETVYQGYGRSAIYVVVAIHEYALLASQGLVDALYRCIHAIHQEGVVQVEQARTEEFLRLGSRLHSSLAQ